MNGEKEFKIHGIMIVKDEVDVISFTVDRLKTWIDKLYILDNGSTDGTWEYIQAIADDVVIPWKQDPSPFSGTMRSALFNEFCNNVKPGDWWCCKCDSDEEYVQDPRVFLSRIPRIYDSVYKRSIDYVLTFEDLEEYSISDISFENNIEYLRYFKSPAWSEVRFIKHKKGLVWPENEIVPRTPGIVFPDVINVRHYQFRSPVQMQKRLDIRRSKTGIVQNGKSFRHVTQDDWHELLMHRSDLIYDDGSEIELYNSIPLRKNLKKSLPRNIARFFRFWFLEYFRKS